MAGSRLKRKKAKRTAQQAEKRRGLKTVLHNVLYQILLWGCWISIYLGWIPDDEPSRLIRLAVLSTPVVLYIAPLLFCVISAWILDLIFDWIREWAWCLVIYLWAPWFLSLLLGKERSIDDYVKAYPATRLHIRDNGDTVRICTSEGLQLWAGFAEVIFKAYYSNQSWAGSFSSEHLRLTGHRCRINMKPSFSASFENLLLDLSKLAKLLIDHYKGDGKEAEAYMQQLYDTMTTSPVGANSAPVDKERFLKFIGKHLAFKPPRQKRIFITDLFKVLRALGSADRAAFDDAMRKINTKDWRVVAEENALLKRTLYFHPKKPNSAVCRYGPGPEELFRFVRNFLEHGGDVDEHGQQRVGSLEDIDCAGPDLFPAFTVKLTYQLVMLLDMGGLLDYAWENLK